MSSVTVSGTMVHGDLLLFSSTTREEFMSIASFWLPIVLSGVLVFIASALINMLFKFWHAPDYHGFSNEDEIAAAMRKGGAAPGAYAIPYCKSMEALKDPALQEKFKQGPVANINIRANGQ